MTTSFHNKTIYITGGASGLGLTCAKRMAQLGANVAILDIQDTVQAQLQIEAARVKPNTQRVIAKTLDVTQAAACVSTINDLAMKWGKPDFVLHAAGVPGGRAFDEASAEDFDRVIQINLYGTRHVAAAVLPWLEQSKGRLIMVASMAGLVGCYGYTAYGSSKFAVIGFAQALRYEYAPKGVRIGIVCPTEFASPLVEAENKVAHPATQLLRNFAGETTAEAVVALLERHWNSKRFQLVPGLLSNLLLLQMRLLPQSLIHAVGDWQIRKSDSRQKRS